MTSHRCESVGWQGDGKRMAQPLKDQQGLSKHSWKCFLLQANKNVMFKVTSMHCLEAFQSYGLRWWLFVCWVFWGAWVLLSSVKGMRGRKSSGPTEEDLKIKRLAFFFAGGHNSSRWTTWPKHQQGRRGEGIFCLLICKETPGVSLFWKEIIYMVIPHTVAPHPWQSPTLSGTRVLEALSHVWM